MMEQKRLGDIATYINGFAFKPEDRGTVGLPIIRIQDLTGNAYDLGFYDGNYPERIEINDGDVLISWSASLGVYVWNKGKALLNQHIFKVAFDKCEVKREYFVYAVRYKLKEMESKTHGATMKHIVKKDFDNTLIPFPAFDEQRRIAESLDTAYAIITARQQQLQNLDELVKARFVELFGSVDDNQKDIKTIRVGDACTLINGRAFKPDEWSTEGLPIVRIQNLNSEEAPFNYYSGEVKSQHLINSGDLLFSWSGTPGTSFGAFFWRRGKAALNQHIFKVIPNCDYNLFFLQYALNERLNFIISRAHGGVGLQHITKKELDEVLLFQPGINEQNDFATFVEQVNKSKVAVQKSLDEAQLLFDSLMQQYFG